MASSYTSLLKFNKPALGDAGWGTSVNAGFTDMVEQALTGAVNVAVTSGGTTTVPTIADGVSSDARNQFITITGSLTSVQTATVQLPAGTSTNFKLYFVKNSAGGTVTVTTATGTNVAVPNGASMILRVTNAGVEATMTHAVSLTLGTALAATSGGTGQASYAVGDLLYASSTTALSKLTVGATNAVLTVAAGIPSWVATLPVASGGTGAATLAANNVLLGNGTSAVQTVAPGTAGNLLTSSGGTWVSAPPPAGGVTSLNSQTGAVVTTGFGDIGSVAVLMIATNTNVAAGSTVSGSDLRYGWTANAGAITNGGFTDFASNRGEISATYNGGGTAPAGGAGVWRKVSSGPTYLSSGGAFANATTFSGCCGPVSVVQYKGFAYIWAAALYVRVS